MSLEQIVVVGHNEDNRAVRHQVITFQRHYSNPSDAQLSFTTNDPKGKHK